MDRNSFLLRWAANAAAIWVAIQLVPGIQPVRDDFIGIAVVALIFGLVNAVIRPIVMLLTCPFIILTLGLGTLVINAAMFALAGEIGQSLNFGFIVADFWAAFWGALVVSIVSAILSSVVGKKPSGDEA